MIQIAELTEEMVARGLRGSHRRRLMAGEFRDGGDVRSLRCFVGLSEEHFAQAMGVPPHELLEWEQGASLPKGPALALLRVAARHPRALRALLTPAP